MKKRLLSLVMMCSLLLCMAVPAHAETHSGGDDWSVTFTNDKKMESNFSSNSISDVIMGEMQPGDEALFTLKLSNTYSGYTDWYMSNTILKSLEDQSHNAATSGGAYTYYLSYTPNGGGEKVLFDSDTVGGEDPVSAAVGLEGLHEATNSLKNWFYLDTLNTGEGGVINLKVALDGETQGNDYQDTLAELKLQFAVELANSYPESATPEEDTDTEEGEATTPGEEEEPENPVPDSATPGEQEQPQEGELPNTFESPEDAREQGRKDGAVAGQKAKDVLEHSTGNNVRTGDDVNMIPYIIAAGISGLVLLLVALGSLKRALDKKN